MPEMHFRPPSWIPKRPWEIPDSIPICDFMFEDGYGRCPLRDAKPSIVCSLSGKTLTALAIKEQIDILSRGLSKELGWKPNEGTEWSKVAGVFSVNTIDFLPLSWAVHRLGGIVTPANAQHSASDLGHQLRDSGVHCLFTCIPLLDTALQAAEQIGLPQDRIYLMELPEEAVKATADPGFKTVAQLMEAGKSHPPLEKLNWASGDGKARVAYVLYSSGTSGLPKGVILSHYNIIANTLQIVQAERASRLPMEFPGNERYAENVLGLLPLSHVYGLVWLGHATIFQGDSLIVLPKFEFKSFLAAVQNHRINSLYLVPPIVVQMTKNKPILDQFDLSQVSRVFCGAAPLGKEVADELLKMFPTWKIRQCYGITETGGVVSITPSFDIWYGSSGSLIADIDARLVPIRDAGAVDYNQPGELLVKSPSLALGYLNNEKADRETFVIDENGQRWMQTGDIAVFRKASSGTEHIFIVDRIKELIKVKGYQVAPAELEAHLLAHPHVADCAVIPAPDEVAGEVPKAFVVKSPSIGADQPDHLIAQEICSHVEQHKGKHNWLRGGVEFIDVIPKSPSGKILRRILRDRDAAARKRLGAKL